MGVQAGTAALQGGCQHHWIIDRPNGSISAGRCKLCGDERVFQNSSGVESGPKEKFCRGCSTYYPATPEFFAFKANGQAYLQSKCRTCVGSRRQERKARERERSAAPARQSTVPGKIIGYVQVPAWMLNSVAGARVRGAADAAAVPSGAIND